MVLSAQVQGGAGNAPVVAATPGNPMGAMIPVLSAMVLIYLAVAFRAPHHHNSPSRGVWSGRPWLWRGVMGLSGVGAALSLAAFFMASASVAFDRPLAPPLVGPGWVIPCLPAILAILWWPYSGTLWRLRVPKRWRPLLGGATGCTDRLSAGLGTGDYWAGAQEACPDLAKWAGKNRPALVEYARRACAAGAGDVRSQLVNEGWRLPPGQLVAFCLLVLLAANPRVQRAIRVCCDLEVSPEALANSPLSDRLGPLAPPSTAEDLVVALADLACLWCGPPAHTAAAATATAAGPAAVR